MQSKVQYAMEHKIKTDFMAKLDYLMPKRLKKVLKNKGTKENHDSQITHIRCK